jgi:hypothetical protein
MNLAPIEAFEPFRRATSRFAGWATSRRFDVNSMAIAAVSIAATVLAAS